MHIYTVYIPALPFWLAILVGPHEPTWQVAELLYSAFAPRRSRTFMESLKPLNLEASKYVQATSKSQRGSMHAEDI